MDRIKLIIWATLFMLSACGSGDTDSGGTPAVPYDLFSTISAVPVHGHRVDISWVRGNKTPEKLELDRCDQSDCLTIPLNKEDLSFADKSLKPGTVYIYTLKATGKGGPAEEDTVLATTPFVNTNHGLPLAPQGSFVQGGAMLNPFTPTAVEISSNIELEKLRSLTDETSTASLHQMLALLSTPLSVNSVSPSAKAPAGTVHIHFHQFGNASAIALPESMQPFDRMGEEGYVLLVTTQDDGGAHFLIGANKPVGLYRGGMSALHLLVKITEETISSATPAPWMTVSLKPKIFPQLILDYPDSSIRAASPSNFMHTIHTGLPTDRGIARIDRYARAGMNRFFLNQSSNIYLEDRWKDYGEVAFASVGALAEARFAKLIPWAALSMQSHKNGGFYPYVDGLAVFDEPFLIVGGVAQPENPAVELLPQGNMNEPSETTTWVATANSGTDCVGVWEQDTTEKRGASGSSWRADVGSKLQGKDCILRSDFSLLTDTKLEKGRYLLRAYAKQDQLQGGWVQVSYRLTLDAPLASTGKDQIGFHLGFPSTNKTLATDSDWVEYTLPIEVDEELAERTITSAQVWSRTNATGKLWLDDLQFKKMDPILRNIAGGASPPEVKSFDGINWVTHVEGVDYQVCQIGIEEIFCDRPMNYIDQVDYGGDDWRGGGDGFADRYNENLAPYEIRWIGDSLPTDDRIFVSYDVNYAYLAGRADPVSVHLAQQINYCLFDEIFETLGLDIIYQRIVGSGQHDEVKIHSSEVRGINRSKSCFKNVDGKYVRKKPNPYLFADMVNRQFQAVKSKNANARAYLWADMFSPVSNGGIRDYQTSFGGTEGASVCAIAPYLIPGLCEGFSDIVPIDSEITMVPWSYNIDGFRSQVASARFYDQAGNPHLAGTARNPVTVQDWASLAHSSIGMDGVMAMDFYGGDPIIQFALQTFWNHDWRLLGLVDFENNITAEFELDNLDYELTAGMVIDTTGIYALGTRGAAGNRSKISKGSLDLQNATGAPLIVHAGEIKNNSSVETAISLRDETGTFDIKPRITVSWWSGGQLVEKTIAEGDDIKDMETGNVNYHRYQATFQQPPGGPYTASFEYFYIDDSVSPARGFSYAENVGVWEAIAPCFDGCSN